MKRARKERQCPGLASRVAGSRTTEPNGGSNDLFSDDAGAGLL
jgi:hypothetical protein